MRTRSQASAQQDQPDADQGVHQGVDQHRIEQLVQEVATQRQEMEAQRQENRDLMETVNRLVSQIGDNRDLPPPAVRTSSSSSELMSQQNQALKWLDKVFKLEATTTQQKAIEWIQLVEANLRRSPLPEARWVPMAGYRADSYFSRIFTEWEREYPGLDWTGFRNQFMNISISTGDAKS